MNTHTESKNTGRMDVHFQLYNPFLRQFPDSAITFQVLEPEVGDYKGIERGLWKLLTKASGGGYETIAECEYSLITFRKTGVSATDTLFNCGNYDPFRLLVSEQAHLTDNGFFFKQGIGEQLDPNNWSRIYTRMFIIDPILVPEKFRREGLGLDFLEYIVGQVCSSGDLIGMSVFLPQQGFSLVREVEQDWAQIMNFDSLPSVPNYDEPGYEKAVQCCVDRVKNHFKRAGFLDVMPEHYEPFLLRVHGK